MYPTKQNELYILEIHLTISIHIFLFDFNKNFNGKLFPQNDVAETGLLPSYRTALS